MLKRVAGTKDILPKHVGLWQELEQISRDIFSLYDYQEIRPPLLEDAALFNRSLGERAEIVQKQMFLIKKDRDIYALRPEGTASIVRAYLENNLAKTNPFVKLYYIGPMFRLERPQKGRFRQFHHIGCEVIGSDEPWVDVEVISLADRLLKDYAIQNYKIKLNSLGCSQDKKKLSEILHKLLKDKITKLCADCQVRFKHNILRIMDCKNQACQEVLSNSNLGQDYLCAECLKHFLCVQEGLKSIKLDFEISPYLVRGLDYYTRTVFEIKHASLGSQQDALGAGGRYDNLVKDLGGPATGAIGFAFGLERLLLVTDLKAPSGAMNLVYLITLGEEAKKPGLKLLQELRLKGIVSDMDYEAKSLKGALRKADDLDARYVLILGEDELKEDCATLKDMHQGTQEKIKLPSLISEILTKIKNVKNPHLR